MEFANNSGKGKGGSVKEIKVELSGRFQRIERRHVASSYYQPLLTDILDALRKAR